MPYHYDCACLALASILHRNTSDCAIGQQTSPVAEKKRKGEIELFILNTKWLVLLSFRLREFPYKGHLCLVPFSERKTFKFNCWGNYFRTIHGDKTFWGFFPRWRNIVKLILSLRSYFFPMLIERGKWVLLFLYFRLPKYRIVLFFMKSSYSNKTSIPYNFWTITIVN